jgi:PKD repeat protein
MISFLLLSSTAFAWKHTGNVWSRDELPLRWYISDHISETIDPGATNLLNTYQYDVIGTAYDNWVLGAPCGQLSHEFQEIREGHHTTGRDSSDQRNTFYYDDPNDEQGGGVLGVTYTQSTGQIAFNRDGRIYRYSFDADIVFSTDVNWIKTTELEVNCSGTPLEAVATHEIGHQWGMGHSCEENEVSAGLCEDSILRDANMFWAAPQCLDFNPDVVFTNDDVQGMTALYGPYATFEASSETYGGVPLEVCFEVSSASDISSVEWLYGDGQSDVFETASESLLQTCHTYEEKGQYTVNVTIRGESDDCDEWEYTDRERAMVVVCEVPSAATGFDGLFTYEPVEDLTYQMINQADTTVYGCIDEIQWDVYKGTEIIRSLNAWSPKVDFTDEGPGEYKVVLTLGGPGGEIAEELSVTIEENKADGCSSVSGLSGYGIYAGFLALLGITRRRES